MNKVNLIPNLTNKIVLIFIFLSSIIYSQILVSEKIDLQSGINEQKIQVEILPSTLAPNVNNLFDGQNFSFVGGSVDSITVTVSFDEAIKISECKTFFVLYAGQYSLEAASTDDDFNSRTGTYQQILNNKNYVASKLDSVEINLDIVKVLRLTAKNPQTKTTYIGEWSLYYNNKIVSLIILPYPPRLLPNTSIKLKAEMLDEKGKTYPYTLNENISWTSSNPTIASFNDDNSILTGKQLGNTTITAQTASGILKGTATATVENDFVSEKAATRIVKVAVVYQDPMVGIGEKFHNRYGWQDPKFYVQELVKAFKTASDGVIQFELTEVHDDQVLFSKLDTTYLTVGQVVTYLDEPGWATIRNLAEKENRIKFDYKGMLKYYDFYNKRQQGLIDEVWVYAWPFGGMYESQLVGVNAFWWNSPPISDVPAEFTKLISVMGLNYERGVAEAMESFGHRMESALWHTFGRWDGNNPNPNNWEIFTTIDKNKPGMAQVGNIHFPHNGMSDYDFSNSRMAASYADNWKRFPWLLDEKRTFNCSDWGCSHLGYMKWWYNHLPRYQGITDGILNNWWLYWADYEGAVDLAKETPVVKVEDDFKGQPQGFKLEQNFPNPFNPNTTIHFQIPTSGFINLKIYDTLGREVKTLLNKEASAGSYSVNFNAAKLASGVYFYKLQAGAFSQTKKLILMK
ncbi:MAG: T9SS type A sorting domain-containing protein [Ignavibacteriales bacterium]|nr:T9SS type A sorting domain-containing protein [Ignavibacteriales bacterium]